MTKSSENSQEPTRVDRDTAHVHKGGESAQPKTNTTAAVLRPEFYLSGDVAEVVDRKECETQIPGFQLLGSHAQGGLGRIQAAVEHDIGRTVAVKDIQPQHATNLELSERFQREARVTGVLQHPNIVPVYRSGTYPDGRPYYVMPLINGATLGELIHEFHKGSDRQNWFRAGKHVEFRRMLDYLRDACSAIHYAHKNGVIHRDINPANIMVGEHDEVFVMDWGLTKHVDHENRPQAGASRGSDSVGTVFGTVMGTPGFMSPEQAEGAAESAGPATDVFGLGATLYVMLTGQLPFQADTTEQVLVLTRRGEFRRPRSINSRIPRPLESICIRAMQLKPADRYQTAGDISKDLESWLAGESVFAHRESKYESIVRWTSRQASWLLPTIAALILLTAVGVVSLVMIQTQRNRIRTANNNRKAAEERATLEENSRRYASLVNVAEEWLKSRHPGGRRPALEAVDHADQIETPLSNSARLRSLKAGLLTSPDLDLRWSIVNDYPVRDFAVSPTGSTMAVCHTLLGISDAAIDLLDIQTGKRIRTLATAKAFPLRITTTGVQNVCFSDDGRFVAGSDRNGIISVWDLHAPGQRLPRWRWATNTGHEKYAHLHFAQNSSSLFSFDGLAVKRWNLQDTESPTKQWRAEVDKRPDNCCFDVNPASGNIIVSLGTNGIVVLDKDSLEPVRQQQPTTYQLNCAPNGRFLLSCYPEILQIRSLPDLVQSDQHRFRDPTLQLSHESWVTTVDIHPNSTIALTITSATKYEGSGQSLMRLWDIASGRLLQAMPLGESGFAQFSPDGVSVLVLADRETRCYRLEGIATLTTEAHLETGLGSCDYIPGTTNLLCTSNNPTTLKTWSGFEHTFLSSTQLKSEFPTGLAMHPERTAVALIHHNGHRLSMWDIGSDIKEQKSVDVFYPGIITFDASGEIIWVTADAPRDFRGLSAARIEAIRYPDGKRLGSWVNLFRSIFRQSSKFTCLAAGKNWVASGGHDKLVRVFGCDGSADLPLLASYKMAAVPSSIAVSPDGQHLIVGLQNGDLVSVDRPAEAKPSLVGQQTQQAFATEPNSVSALAFSPDGKWLVSATARGRVRIRQCENGSMDEYFTLQLSRAVVDLKFSPSGQELIFRGEQARALQRLHFGRLLSQLQQGRADYSSISAPP